MIRSIRHKGLKRFYETDDARGIFGEHVQRIRDILARLDAARVIGDLNMPGFRLHTLQGHYRGLHAITVRANWRIVFRFVQPDVWDVDYVDYH